MTVTRIVYVEDNEDLREAMTMLLERRDREIVTCVSGEAALAAIAHRQADVLVTDLGLPGISGIELARRVLAGRPLQWVIFCSGFGADPVPAALGPNVRSLAKPFDIDVLDELLDRIASSGPPG